MSPEDTARREGFLQGLRKAAEVVAEHGCDVMPASEIYERISVLLQHEEESLTGKHVCTIRCTGLGAVKCWKAP